MHTYTIRLSTQGGGLLSTRTITTDTEEVTFAELIRRAELQNIPAQSGDILTIGVKRGPRLQPATTPKKRHRMPYNGFSNPRQGIIIYPSYPSPRPPPQARRSPPATLPMPKRPQRGGPARRHPGPRQPDTQRRVSSLQWST